MIGRTVIYRRKDTKEYVGKLNDSTGPLEDAMETYALGHNIRRGDEKYAHLPHPDEVEAVEYDVWRSSSVAPSGDNNRHLW